jgi:hypothetical protein
VSSDEKDKKNKKGKEKDDEKSKDEAITEEGEVESERQQEVKGDKRSESGVTDPGERVWLRVSKKQLMWFTLWASPRRTYPTARSPRRSGQAILSRPHRTLAFPSILGGVCSDCTTGNVVLSFV